MRIGLVVDSACDLPQRFIQDHKIVVMPITIHLGERDLVDSRDPTLTQEFYSRHLGAKGDAGTSPFSVEQIKNLFLSELVIDYDFVFCLTIASSRSPIFDNATKASHAILNEYKPIRARAGINGPFALRVVDCQNLFAGQGVLAVEAVRLIKAGESPNRIREKLEHLAQNIHGYMLPRDLFYLRARAQKKGDKSVGWFGAVLGSALDIKPLIKGYRNSTGPCAKLRHFDDGAQRLFQYTEARIRKGLMTPTLCVSYGGELAELDKLPGYASLQKTAAEHGVEMLVSTLSVTGAINVGEGALALAFADEPHEFA
ncbi:MAG TPA: DegV family protein [Nevskiaceae bacterium]|nr:DegV family protein [Nevskiaceae bacterium]